MQYSSLSPLGGEEGCCKSTSPAFSAHGFLRVTPSLSRFLSVQEKFFVRCPFMSVYAWSYH
nr:MAG TPA: hypothetical protein [Caudoviricetes sp.]